VVWLDELQYYLDGPDGLTAAVVRELVNPPHPAVVIGTLWPDLYTGYTAVPAPGAADPHARERQLLDLATVVRIGPAFSPAEQARAHAAAVHDPRLKAALESAGYGLTQTLAAAPQLVACWHDAQTADPYAWAVLTAALDVARLGARGPLSGDFLRAAAPGYLTSRQQAQAPGDWFEQALDYATGMVHGAAATLTPAGDGMGQVAGYTAADYLIQHATRQRRSARVPASTWDAALRHLHDPADTARLATSAENRLLYCYAAPLYRHAADVGDGHAAEQLAWLLVKRGDLDELRARADTGDGDAAGRLVDLLADRGDLDGLQARADTGDGHAAYVLTDLLAKRGDLDELRARADTGNRFAAHLLAGLLADRGDLDGLQVRADTGDRYAAGRLPHLLAERGDLDELRACADLGHKDAAERLAGLLAERGDLDEAEQVLRTRADTGHRSAAQRLAGLLAKRGNLDELRARAGTGDIDAAKQLTDLLAERGDLDGLQARANAGNGHAAYALAGLLAKRGNLDELRARADAGDGFAAQRLAGLLAERGDLDELRARTDAGDRNAAHQLPLLLTQQGRGDEGDRLRRFGLNPDGSIASA
jgi:hypothetical protein